ncbi:phosphatase PAP2 family protein [Streptomyces deccanensis]|uniref:phosphatase PAP2 family protein n=1 Tax=Streptomyces deccanensis TaxID=424188 RepID=UPI001EFBE454|nr:phosphatase PAP2 family protein [Streptomyces deccanensis]ULR48872.1 phosphatase PAP2 family protein [Streptomyces deccanensis]
MTLAQVGSNVIGKQVIDRRRPPLVAVERVRSGAHFPSDVAAGAVLALAAAWTTRRLPRLLLLAVRRLP